MRSLVFGFLVSLSGLSFAYEIRTAVTTTSQVSHLWRNEQPFVWFKCWGGTGDIDAFEDGNSGKKTTYNTPSGTSAIEHSGGSRRVGFRPFAPQNLTWRTDVTGVRDFSIEFSQRLTLQQTTEKKDDCNVDRFHSRLDGLENSLTSTVTMVVPEHIYVIKIKKVVSQMPNGTFTPLKSEIHNIRPIGPSESSPGGMTLSLDLGESKYLFVTPGSEVSLAVQWGNKSLTDLDMKVKFELRMIGEDECAEFMDPKSKLSSNDYAKFYDEVLNPRDISSNPEAYISNIGCLRNPKFVQASLEHMHPLDFVKILEQASLKFGDRMVLLDARKQGEFGQAAWAVTYMTFFDLSKAFLKEIKKYCEMVTVKTSIGLETDEKIRVNDLAENTMSEIKFLLETVPLKTVGVLAEEIQKMEKRGLKYSDIPTGSDLYRLLNSVEKNLVESDLDVYDVIKQKYASLPHETSLAHQHELDVRHDLTVAHNYAQQIIDQFKIFYAGLSAQRDEVVRLDHIYNLYSGLANAHSAVLNSLGKDMEFFGLHESGLGTVSYRSMSKMNSLVFYQALNFLSTNFDSVMRANGSSGAFLDHDSNERLRAEIDDCVRGKR